MAAAREQLTRARDYLAARPGADLTDTEKAELIDHLLAGSPADEELRAALGLLRSAGRGS